MGTAGDPCEDGFVGNTDDEDLHTVVAEERFGCCLLGKNTLAVDFGDGAVVCFDWRLLDNSFAGDFADVAAGHLGHCLLGNTVAGNFVAGHFAAGHFAAACCWGLPVAGTCCWR